MLNWIPLTSVHEVEALKNRSHEIPCLIFKHSNRCNVSAIAKYRLEDDWSFESTQIEAYFLDLLQFKSTSHFVADTFQVFHESPQVLLILNGQCVYDASHLDISVEELKESLASVEQNSVS